MSVPHPINITLGLQIGRSRPLKWDTREISVRHPLSKFILFSLYSRRAGALAVGALLLGHAQGAELGEVTLHSFIGQPLVADIELTALTPDEVAGLQVRPASPDVYRGANIGMHPALATRHLALMRHDDQRQFLHLSSPGVVDQQHVNLFLALGVGGRLAVRGATLWLAPDPHPAAPPLPVPLPHLSPESVASMVPAPRARRHAVPERFRPQPAARPERACRPQAEERLQACAELDTQNAALNSKIVDLEGKVNVLQVALKRVPPATVASTVAPAKALHRPANKAAEAPSTLIFWSGGAAALLAIGAGCYLFLRRRKVKAPFQPSRYWVLLRSPFRRKARK